MVNCSSSSTSTSTVKSSLSNGLVTSLECWLYHLKFMLPDETLRAGLWEVTIQQLQCTQFGVDAIESFPQTRTATATVVLENGSNSTEAVVVASLLGMKGVCTGTYRTNMGLMEGHFQAHFLPNSTLTVGIPIRSSSSPLVLSPCNTTALHIGPITFYGSFSSKFLQLFSSLITSHINQALQTYPCPSFLIPAFQSYTNNTLLPFLLQRMHQLIHNGTPSQTDPTVISPNTTTTTLQLVDWKQDTPFFYKALTTINSILSNYKYVQGCSIINQLFHIMTNDTIAILPPSENDISSSSSLLTWHWTKLFNNTSNITLQLNYIQISGLSRFTNLTILQPTTSNNSSASNTMNQNAFHAFISGVSTKASKTQNNITTQQPIRISFGAAVQVNTTLTSIPQVLNENFTIHVNFSDITLWSRLFVGVPSSFLSSPIGDLFDELKQRTNQPWRDNTSPSNITTTTTNTTTIINITNLEAILSITNAIIQPSSSLPLEYGLDELLNNMLTLILQHYNKAVRDVLYGSVQGPLRSLINQYLSSSTKKDELFPISKSNYDTNYHTAVPPTNNFFQFDTNSLIQWINNGFNSNIGLRSINNVMKCLTDTWEKQQQEQQQKKMAITVTTKQKKGLSIRWNTVHIENSNRIYDFAIIAPEIDHYHVINKIGAGQCSILHPESTYTGTLSTADNKTCYHPLRISVGIEVEDVVREWSTQVNASLTLGNWYSNYGTNIEFDLNKFSALSLFQVFNEISCNAVPFSRLQLYDFNLGNMEVLDFKIQTHPLVSGRNLKQKVPQLWTLVDNITNTTLINDYIQVFSSRIEELFNDASQPFLYQSPYICNNMSVPPFPSGRGVHYEVGVGISLVGLSVIFLTYHVHRRQIPRKIEADERSVTEPLLITLDDLMDKEAYMESYQRQKIDQVVGLAFQSTIGNSLRYLIPLVLIGTLSLFVNSNLSIGAYLSPVLYTNTTNDGDGGIPLPPSFSFSLGNTITGMYHAGVYVLMIIILVFSGIWPYVKLLMMLLAWILPPNILCPERRGRLLVLLDVLGKYSLVDSFVLILFMVGFCMHLELSTITSTTTTYALDLHVEPQYGFYCFLTATVISLLMGHVILYYHRRSQSWKKPLATVVEYDVRESVMQHHFASLKCPNINQRMEMSHHCKILIVALILISATLLFIGSFVPSFTMEIFGITRLLMATSTDADRSYSFVTLGHAIISSSADPHALSARLLQLFYYFFGLFTPLLCLACLTLLLCWPMNLRLQYILLLCADVAYAWSGMEVFVLSVGVSMWQISRFTQFMVGDKCNLLNKLIKMFLKNELDGNAVCFNVQTSLKSGFLVLFFGTLLCCIFSWLLLQLTHQAFEERLVKEGVDGIDNSLISESASSQHEDMPSRSPSIIDHFPSFLFTEVVPISLVVTEESLAGEDVVGNEDDEETETDYCSQETSTIVRYTAFLDCFPESVWNDIPKEFPLADAKVDVNNSDKPIKG